MCSYRSNDIYTTKHFDNEKKGLMILLVSIFQVKISYVSESMCWVIDWVLYETGQICYKFWCKWNKNYSDRRCFDNYCNTKAVWNDSKEIKLFKLKVLFEDEFRIDSILFRCLWYSFICRDYSKYFFRSCKLQNTQS